MQNQEYNNDFYSYNGYIGRKNYAINMLILVSICVLVEFINLNVLFPNPQYPIIIDVLDFIIRLFQLVVLFASVSTIYRRLADISKNQSENFRETIKKLFGILFIFPILYLLAIRYFLETISFLINILDLLTFFVILPIAGISILLIAFIKGK